MIYLHGEALIIIAIILGAFLLILILFACLILDKNGCCKRQTNNDQRRHFTNLNELLFALDDRETAVLEENGQEISVESFFPDILHDKQTTNGTEQGGLEEPLL